MILRQMKEIKTIHKIDDSTGVTAFEQMQVNDTELILTLHWISLGIQIVLWNINGFTLIKFVQ